MPTNPFLEVNPPVRHVGPPADASTFTRSVRLAATIAPYIGQVGDQKPTLGWKSNELAAQVRITAPVYGILRNLYPNGK